MKDDQKDKGSRVYVIGAHTVSDSSLDKKAIAGGRVAKHAV